MLVGKGHRHVCERAGKDEQCIELHFLPNEELRAAKENLFVFPSLNQTFIFVLGTVASGAIRTFSYHSCHHSLKFVLDFIFCSRKHYNIVF